MVQLQHLSLKAIYFLIKHADNQETIKSVTKKNTFYELTILSILFGYFASLFSWMLIFESFEYKSFWIESIPFRGYLDYLSLLVHSCHYLKSWRYVSEIGLTLEIILIRNKRHLMIPNHYILLFSKQYIYVKKKYWKRKDA